MKSKVYIIHSQIPLGWQGLLTSFKMTLKFKNILKNWDIISKICSFSKKPKCKTGRKKYRKEKISYITWETMGKQNIKQEKLELFFINNN